jgi:hypothetical protein
MGISKMSRKRLESSPSVKECPNGHSSCRVCNLFASRPDANGTRLQIVWTLLQTLRSVCYHSLTVRTLLGMLKSVGLCLQPVQTPLRMLAI